MRTQAFEEFCPACGHKNEAGVTSCKFCGGRLSLAVADPHTTGEVDTLDRGPLDLREQFPGGLIPPSAGIALYLPGIPTAIAVRMDQSFIVGRADADADESLVDLTAFDGFGQGVSRQHVMIRPARNGYDIIDLESRNGTWINDERLVPSRSYPLPSQAHIRLGMMKLFVAYQPRSGS
jgi:hypothetical protein